MSQSTIPPLPPRLGRSAPRSKTGCLTCRKRKVRCDEARPVCANCSRRRISCHFAGVTSTQQLQLQSNVFPAGAEAVPGSQNNGSPVFPRANSPPASGMGVFEPNSFDYSLTLDQMHGDFPSLSPIFGQGPWNPPSIFNSTLDTSQSPEQRTLRPSTSETAFELAADTNSSATMDELQTQFLALLTPPRFVLSIDDNWLCDRHAIFKMAETCPPLMNAIYAFTDAHSARVRGSDTALASAFYQQASTKAQELSSKELEDQELQQLLATLLLLIYVELLHPAPSQTHHDQFHLRSVHAVLHKYRSRTQGWRGLGQRLVVWLNLFDCKAMFAGREITPNDHEFLRNDDTKIRTEWDHSWHPPDSGDTSEILFGAIDQAPFVFYLGTQRLKARITLLNMWNRARGSLDDEIEVLQAGKKIDAVLEAHWTDRPLILDRCLNAEVLLDSLQGCFAQRLTSRIRLYRADYFAHVIYLHRVAFRAFAKEKKVEAAIAEVLKLANAEATESVLSPSWLWPLFMVAVEGSQDHMDWVESEFRRMVATNDVDHILAPRALQILNTLTQRVKEGVVGVDYRQVQQELFDGYLQII